MKVLKKKRNSLRSLFRRSLVILSLLALVFASCSSDDGGSNTPSDPGDPTTPVTPVSKVAVSLKIIRQPISVSYEGMPADLSGIGVEVRFREGSNEYTEYIEDPKQFFISPFILDSNGGVALITTDMTALPSLTTAGTHFPLYHVTSRIASDEVVLQVIRGLDATTPVHYTGRLTKRDYFEDDLVDFNGITVEGVYDALDLSSKAGVPTALQKVYPKENVPIALSEAYLDDNFGGSGIQGIDGVDKLINFKITTNAIFQVPFDNFYTIRRVSLVSGGATGDYYQYDDDPADPTTYWFREFEKGNATFKVEYAGTSQTKTIGMKEIYRAAEFIPPRATLNSPANLLSGDPDAVLVRLDYYGSARFPNQVIDMPISVWEFDEGIEFVLKPNMSDKVIPLQVKAGSDNEDIENDLQLIQAIAATYDLSAVYTKGSQTKYKSLNSLLVNSAYGVVTDAGKYFSTAGVLGGAGHVDIENTGDETLEQTLLVAVPRADISANIPGGADFATELEIIVLP